MEGTRINASVGVYRDAAKDSTLYDNGKEVSVSAGCRLMCDLVSLICKKTVQSRLTRPLGHRFQGRECFPSARKG